jgi:hypothetical protein
MHRVYYHCNYFVTGEDEYNPLFVLTCDTGNTHGKDMNKEMDTDTDMNKEKGTDMDMYMEMDRDSDMSMNKGIGHMVTVSIGMNAEGLVSRVKIHMDKVTTIPRSGEV